jgi:hypothetical protein
MVVGELNRDTNFFRPKHPEPTRPSIGRNYKAIKYIKMRVELGSIIPRGLSFRDKSYMGTRRVHKLGKVLHLGGTAEIFACTLAIPGYKLHGVCSSFEAGAT